MSGKPNKPFYVSNIALYEVYVPWLEKVREAEKNGKEIPEIPRFIAESMMKICTRLTYSPKFINYSFKAEMIGDALYDCVKYATKFKPSYISKKGEFAGQERVGNPFSYITTIAFNAFLRRIDTEHKQSYVKAMIIAETPVHEFFDSIESDDVELQQIFTEFVRENSDNLTNNMPQALKKKAKKLKELQELDLQAIDSHVNLENFQGEDEVL
jgi:hypothetical protein